MVKQPCGVNFLSVSTPIDTVLVAYEQRDRLEFLMKQYINDLQKLFAGAQMLPFHPVMRKSAKERNNFYKKLEQSISRLGWRNRGWLKAELGLYKSYMKTTAPALDDEGHNSPVDSWLFVADLALISGYNEKLLCSKTLKSVVAKNCNGYRADDIIAALSGIEKAWDALQKGCSDRETYDYLLHLRDNLSFMDMNPYRILVTATMSAGKSSLVNALVGKEISKTQNLACTSNIHSIIAKHHEDQLIYKYDGVLTLDAKKRDIFPKGKDTSSDYATTATFFRGSLGGMRLILKDTPGINSSTHKEHREIAEREVKKSDYDLLVYVMNATQFAINDDRYYLEYVKEVIGDKEVLFVLNKIDLLNPEREELFNFVQSVKEYLRKCGFANPIVCPLSAKIGYLAKNSSREEIDHSDCLLQTDLLKELKIEEYYIENFPHIKDRNLDGFDDRFRYSGLCYLEKIIALFYMGVMKND